MNTRTLLPIALLALLVSGVAGAQVYRWVDKDGKVHYSQQKPPDQKATELKIPTAPSQAAAATDGTAPAAARDPDDPDAPPPNENDAVRAQLEKLRLSRCETARAVFTRYQNAPYLERAAADGTKQRLTPEEEAAERVRVQQEMDEACAPAAN